MGLVTSGCPSTPYGEEELANIFSILIKKESEYCHCIQCSTIIALHNVALKYSFKTSDYLVFHLENKL